MSELIDREETVKQICKMGEMVSGHDRDVVISIALFVQDDKTAFPTVERPHGEWIGDKRLKEFAHADKLKEMWFSHCSVCGELGCVGNYCMWCGAKMKGGE